MSGILREHWDTDCWRRAFFFSFFVSISLNSYTIWCSIKFGKRNSVWNLFHAVFCWKLPFSCCVFFHQFKFHNNAESSSDIILSVYKTGEMYVFCSCDVATRKECYHPHWSFASFLPHRDSQALSVLLFTDLDPLITCSNHRAQAYITYNTKKWEQGILQADYNKLCCLIF